MAKLMFKTFEEACRAVGVTAPKRELNSQKWMLASTEGRKRNSNGRVKLFTDGTGGVVFNWETGEHACWSDNAFRRLSKEEVQKLKEERKKAEIEFNKKEKEAHDNAARIAEGCFLVNYVPYNHKYFELKHLKFEQLKHVQNMNQVEDLDGKWIQIPLYDIATRKIRSMQWISEKGQKLFLTNGEIASNAWVHNWDMFDKSINGTIGIAEGVATALSVMDYCKIDCCLAAMSCHNLIKVANKLRKLYPDTNIVIYADVGNGNQQARLAAHYCEGICITPEFTDEDNAIFWETYQKRPTDWNDYVVCQELKWIKNATDLQN